MELAGLIIQRIKEDGPLCFREFMEMCLYHPGTGYYTSEGNPIGGSGDFYTSANLTPAFGAMIGKQMEEMWLKLDEKAFTIVEYGAGTGLLCCDILKYLQHNERMYDGLQYYIIEKSPAMRAIEHANVNEKVCWVDSIKDIPAINGCILSNELVDNFAVHQVVMTDELMEIFVDYHDGFTEILQPADESLRNYFAELNIALPDGFRTEVNLQAIDWIQEAATALQRGYIMTIDYGYQSAELYKTCRSQGTLVCYHKHTVSDAIYANLGQQDITAHVNFSALTHWGARYGLTDCGFTDQCHFLLSLGFKKYLNEAIAHEQDMIRAVRKAAMLSHTLLIDMGSKFKVLIQEKGGCSRALSGLSLQEAF